MVSNANTKRERNKVKPKWSGPYEVIQIVSKNVYIVESLVGKRKMYHASYLWFYEPKGYVPTEEVRNIFLQDQGELEIEKIANWKQNANGIFLLVKWLGFGPEQDSWEPIAHMFEQAPDLVLQLGKETQNKKLKKTIQELELESRAKHH